MFQHRAIHLFQDARTMFMFSFLAQRPLRLLHMDSNCLVLRLERHDVSKSILQRKQVS